MIFALVGNQNCGKTTLFNQLTGSNQHVGNFPGVTVEKKSGEIKSNKNITVVDLPGIYSLSPYTAEEIVTRDFLVKDRPDGIINIVDVTNIERNLYLTMQLLELGIPTILALNMMDELHNNSGSVHLQSLITGLGIPVVPISATKNDGISELISKSVLVAQNSTKPQKIDFCEGTVHRCIHGISHLIEDHADKIKIPRRFATTKLIEGDKPMLNALKLNENEKEMLEHIIIEMEIELKTDRESALADMRYNFIEALCKTSIEKPKESKENIRSTKIDNLLTHKYLGIPLFLGIMMLIFWLTFGVIGRFFSDMLTLGLDGFSGIIQSGLLTAQINPVVQDLVINGALAGVGSAMSFS